jgi:5,5'-dehydrodivanillate O-demethylase oxygenase subunit
MLTREQNDRLTRVGPGTPCGELLRRYWQPLCAVAELTDKNPLKPVRVMGEDLIVIRRADGAFNCVEEFCRHRRASLRYGFLEDDGIRCCYHGWKYDFKGQCVEQPFEPKGSRLKDEVRIKSYPVQKLGGLLFTYMGPDPSKAPLLPRWDSLVREDGQRILQVLPIHRCNWLQVQENTADSVHTYYLHGHMDKVRGFNLDGAAFYLRPIEKYEWSNCEWGIAKTLYYGGDKPEIEIRPPMVFPNVLRIPQGPIQAIHWRVPIDDTTTRIIWLGFLPATHGGKPMKEGAEPPIQYLPDQLDDRGDFRLDSFYAQDQAVMEAQGPIFDRSLETLGATDRGIVLFRRMLDEQIALVEQGKDPTIAVVRDSERNRIIAFEDATQPWGSVELSFVR